MSDSQVEVGLKSEDRRARARALKVLLKTFPTRRSRGAFFLAEAICSFCAPSLTGGVFFIKAERIVGSTMHAPLMEGLLFRTVSQIIHKWDAGTLNAAFIYPLIKTMS